MKLDIVRLKKYLADIVRSAQDLKRIIENILSGQNDFDQFAEEIENYIQSIK